MRTTEDPKKAHGLAWLRRLALSTVTVASLALGGCDRPATSTRSHAEIAAAGSGEFRPDPDLVIAAESPGKSGASKPAAAPPKKRVIPQVNGRDATELELGKRTTRHVQVDTVLDQVVASLEDGRRSTMSALRNAALGEVVDSILKVDGVQLYDIEAEELVREVYRRAEAHTAGQGDRLLAYLYQQAAAKYPAVAADPAFQPLRAVISADSTPLDPKTFQFAGALDAANVKLSPALDSAVKQLGYVYADGNLSELTQLAERAFRRADFKMSRYLTRAASAHDALKLALGEHVPPPKAEVVMKDLMKATAERSPALQQDRAFLTALEEVSAGGMETIDEAALKNYRNVENQIPSRMDQIQQAKARNFLGAIPQSPELTGSRLSELAERKPPVKTNPTTSLAQSAQRYSDYVSVSFEAPEPRVGEFSSPSGGGGGGGSPSRSTKTYQTRAPSSSYPGVQAGKSAPKVSRNFRAAIGSARAARGVAAGAKYSAPAGVKPLNVAWIAHEEDNRFGRIVALEGQGVPSLAASRTLFADSFQAAADVLWGGTSARPHSGKGKSSW